jgi:hypothetical protein
MAGGWRLPEDGLISKSKRRRQARKIRALGRGPDHFRAVYLKVNLKAKKVFLIAIHHFHENRRPRRAQTPAGG